MLLGVVDKSESGKVRPFDMFTAPSEGVGPDPFRSTCLNWTAGRWTVTFSGPKHAFVRSGPFVSDGFLFCRFVSVCVSVLFCLV